MSKYLGQPDLVISQFLRITVAYTLIFHWHLKTPSLKFQKAMSKIEVFQSLITSKKNTEDSQLANPILSVFLKSTKLV